MNYSNHKVIYDVNIHWSRYQFTEKIPFFQTKQQKYFSFFYQIISSNRCELFEVSGPNRNLQLDKERITMPLISLQNFVETIFNKKEALP